MADACRCEAELGDHALGAQIVGIGQRRTGIRIDTSYRANHRSIRCILRDRPARQRCIGRGFIDVAYAQREALVEAQRVGRPECRLLFGCVV